MNYNIDELLRSRTGGRNLSEADRRFATLLRSELVQFQHQAPKDRALMFHPLGSYERYLIHKVTELFPVLTSFSIGSERNRRVVVCFKSRRKQQQLQLEQTLAEERQPSRGSPKNSRVTTPRGGPKTRTLDIPSRGRSSDHLNRNKLGKYETWNGDALRKRERGLNMEGSVVNGERDFPKSDAEAGRRKSRDYPDLRKHPKHRARRSRSQPHLNERPRPRRRQESFEESSDHQYSDTENFGNRARRPVSENNTPEKRRNKAYKNEPVHEERIKAEVLRSDIDYIPTSSSGSDLFARDPSLENSDIENNEVPPSYENIPDRKGKAKRNLRRIRRSNSTTSCPPLDREKRDYSNRDVMPKKNEKGETFHRGSPVFTKKEKSDAESRNNDARSRTDVSTKKGSVRRKSLKDRKASREYVNAPCKEIRKPDSMELLPFDSLPLDVPDGPTTTNGFAESIPTAENVDPAVDVRLVPPHIENLPNHSEEASRPSVPYLSELQPVTAEKVFKTAQEKLDKECQTDLLGMVVDAMMTTYNAQLDALNRLAPTNVSASQPGSTIPPSSLRTSGTSTPSLSSPASAYEKMGEYMYKAMLNFQNMLLGTIPQPANGPSTFPAPSAMYTPIPPSAQPLYVPWMAQYYPDPNSSRPPYPSQPRSVGDACCQLHHHTYKACSPPEKMPVHSQGSQKDLRKDAQRSTLPRDDPHYWHGNPIHRYRGHADRTPSSADHSVAAQPSQSSKAPDEFESDVSSEVTNPEVTIAPGGDGVMVYVRNSSHRSSSTGGTSIAGSASNLHGPAGDVARESPLGHVSDSVFKKAPNLPVSRDSNKSTRSKEKVSTPKGSPKKSGKSYRKKKSDAPLIQSREIDLVNGPGIPKEEVILSLGSAPLARTEDDENQIEDFASVSFTSSHSSHPDNSPFADSAKSLVGEDLSPLVCFDDNLEIACQDGSAED